MRRLIAGALGLLAVSASLHAQNSSFDAAAVFGARPTVIDLTLAPDGKAAGYITPSKSAGTAVVTLGLEKGTQAHIAATADGNPLRVTDCSWVSNDRLVCDVFGINKDPKFKFIPFTRKLSFDATGANTQQLGNFSALFTVSGGQQTGGEVLDAIPAEGAVLMTHMYIPALNSEGSRATSTATSQYGLGVDYVDTRTVSIKSIEPPSDTAVFYLSDGHGNVRVMAAEPSKATNFGGFVGTFGANPVAGSGTVVNYLYRAPGARAWKPLSTFNTGDQSGFRAVAIDPERNVAYGFEKKSGHTAVYSVKLDDSLAKELVFARDDVDVTGLVQIGPHQKVVGATYTTAKGPEIHYLDPDLDHLMSVFAKAVPDDKLTLIDSTASGDKLLLLASNDADPGIYYLFDRATKQLQTFLPVRKPLEGLTLATVKAVSYPGAGGVSIPASLVLPPGKESAKGLPAIVLQDTGSGARDTTGFDWLAQFFANRGYAVLLPGYRGSEVFGDAWSLKAYPSWSVAVGDVVAGGHWLVSTGVADPKKLAVAGWSYGGYAALQSTVVEPDLFKAAIAIAPATDLGNLKDAHKFLPDTALVNAFAGSGRVQRDGSPIEHVAAIKAPILLFHGGMDMNVYIEESRNLDARLKSAGKPHELVAWEPLDHQLDDSEARTQLLRKSDEFLHKALGL